MTASTAPLTHGTDTRAFQRGLISGIIAALALAAAIVVGSVLAGSTAAPAADAPAGPAAAPAPNAQPAVQIDAANPHQLGPIRAW